MKEKGFSDIRIKEFVSIDLKLRGTHYYTGTDSFRYCESYFGDSDKNRLVFKVNNDGAVSAAGIIFLLYTMSGEDNDEGIKGGGLATESILDVIGLSDSESDNIMDSFMTWNENNGRILSEAEQALDKNNTTLYKQKMNELRSNYPKTFSVWCTKSKRDIDLNISRDDQIEFIRLLITAHT